MLVDPKLLLECPHFEKPLRCLRGLFKRGSDREPVVAGGMIDDMDSLLAVEGVYGVLEAGLGTHNHNPTHRLRKKHLLPSRIHS